MSNKASVFSLDKKFLKFQKRIGLTAKRIFKILKKKNVSAEIYLAGNSKMKFLNKKFRGKNKTTTVLSFNEPRNFIYPKSKIKRIGEIYLNASSAKYRALNRQLLIHGLLHLLGYNHQKKSDRIRMEKMENLVADKLNG